MDVGAALGCVLGAKEVEALLTDVVGAAVGAVVDEDGADVVNEATAEVEVGAEDVEVPTVLVGVTGADDCGVAGVLAVLAATEVTVDGVELLRYVSWSSGGLLLSRLANWKEDFDSV